MSSDSEDVRYAPRPGSYLDHVQANRVGCELSRIEKENNLLTAELVVAEAEPEEAVLHPFFEWDQSRAACEYRKAQARTLIRQVIPITMAAAEDHERDKNVPEFIHIRQRAETDDDDEEDGPSFKRGRGGVYVPRIDVMQDPILRLDHLSDLVHRTAGWRDQLAEFPEMQKFVAAIDQAKAIVSSLKEKAAEAT